MKIVIIDDVRIARSELASMLKELGEPVEIVGMAGNGAEGLDLIRKESPDLAFLDINMPKLSGIDMLAKLGNDSPLVVFTTAYEEYAVQSYNFQVLDYLLKPITENDLKRAITRAKEALKQSDTFDDVNVNNAALNGDSQVLIKDGESCRLIQVHEIDYLESVNGITHVHYDGLKSEVTKPLSKIESRLPSELFFRVSRQKIVNLGRVSDIKMCTEKGTSVLILSNNSEIPVARRQTSKLKAEFGL